MSRRSVLFLLPLLLLACSVAVYAPITTDVGTNLERPTITATMENVVAVMEVCNVKAELGLNLRSGKGTAYSVLDVLPSGTNVQVVESAVLDDGSTWSKIVEEDGTRGWVNARYLCRP